MAKILIPSALLTYTNNTSMVTVTATDVGGALRELLNLHPDMESHLFDAEAQLRPCIRLYLQGEEISQPDPSPVLLEDNDELLIVSTSTAGAHRSEVTLEPEERARYARHLSLAEVGIDGQKKLKAARVLMIGTGGLGSPVGLYLASAGIGTLGIVDFDKVDHSNLHRQVLHGTKDVGRSKLASAKERLSDINPHTVIVTHEVKLTSQNAKEIISGYDIVVDGTDNFATRYLISDACALLGKPNVFGSIFRFEGQVSVFHPAAGGPCYRCLHPEPPPRGLVPTCADGGVLGVLPGVVGTLQATETIKYILGIGRSLVGRLLMFDALAMKFRELQLPRDPQCVLCGPDATVTDLVDDQEFCGGELSPQVAGPEISPIEFRQEWLSGKRPLLIDVRNPHEWEISNLEEYDAKLMPLSNLGDHLHLLEKDSDIVVHCKSGGRSATAQSQLIESGFTKVRNLAGGILRWADEADPSKRKY